VIVARWYKCHVSGWLLAIIAIGLSVAAAYFSDDPSKAALVVKWSARLTVTAALWVFIVAQYDAWNEERNARERAEKELAASQTALATEADIKGQAYDLRISRYAHGMSITSHIYLCNGNPTRTTIRSLILTVSPKEGENLNVLSHVNNKNIPLERGIGSEYLAESFIKIMPEKLDLASLRFTLVDSLGKLHSIQVDQKKPIPVHDVSMVGR